MRGNVQHSESTNGGGASVTDPNRDAFMKRECGMTSQNEDY